MRGGPARGRVAPICGLGAAGNFDDSESGSLPDGLATRRNLRLFGEMSLPAVIFVKI